MLDNFLQSATIGFIIAAIFGPISMYFIERTLKDGLTSAIPISLGTTCGSTIYQFIVCLGLTMISDFILKYDYCLKIIGGIFLLFLGLMQIKNARFKKSKIKKNRNKNLFIQMLLLTLINPITIITYLSFFANIEVNFTFVTSLIMSLGCFLGSILWWIILGTLLLTVRYKFKLSEKFLYRMSIFSGIIISIFGIMTIFSTIYLK